MTDSPQVGLAWHMADLKEKRNQRDRLAKINHGHDFNNQNRRCRCGMAETEYVCQRPFGHEYDERSTCLIALSEQMDNIFDKVL